MSSSDSSSSEKFTGRVKWFNNKAGYGFVTITDGSKSGSDVFIHHSSIKVDAEQYKYLVQGEYIEFTLSNVEGGKHEYQASEVCGIKGGKLMCETRNELKSARTTYKSVNQDDDEPSSPRPFVRQQSVRVPTERVSSERLPRAVRPPTEKRTYKSQKPEQTDGEWTSVVRKSKPRAQEKPKTTDKSKVYEKR
jgi:CspA family cold shock protein